MSKSLNVYHHQDEEDEEEERKRKLLEALERQIQNPDMKEEASWAPSMTLRQELEKQFQNPIHEKSKEKSLFDEIDTSNMNLHEELQARFNALNKNPYQTKITPDLFKADNDNDLENEEEQNPFFQIYGAVKDMTKNYFDMKKDNTIGADDYFHCKANFEAANRGYYGAKTSEWLGDKKEDFDYYYNQLWKGLNQQKAEDDRLHDKRINKIARQRARRRLYLNSRRACHPYRVRGINEKY